MVRNYGHLPGLFPDVKPWHITQEHREFESWSNQEDRMQCISVFPVTPEAKEIAGVLLYHGWGTDVTRASIGYLLGINTLTNVSRGLTALVKAELLQRVPIHVPGQGIRGYWKVFCGMKLCQLVGSSDELRLAPLARKIIDLHNRMRG